ncbi:MAG: M15 family peptidase [Rhodospirillaceae bacterium]|jgi:peptidoglycan LD-endopeptidase CwlK|nr:M15 family peptidase [Rhodospirillaceae bacterium]MDP7547584.1 M15 family peptidase [Alphaproteobacteria bacterium]MBT4741583.1 M15 family peptidase [Rhodospirillaceae bacterium]MBT6261403.1 M15 family peptidase [Rhodospirillaceae bacterium]MBT6677177.1 M15 family peptidase [Rhodospirillaceae bacterium]
MPRFSDKSISNLTTCDTRLQQVLLRVVHDFDCTILEGHRDRERQNRMVDEGKSRVRWPDGKHNTVPSRAVDVAAYPIVWDDRERQTLFAGFVLATAKAMGIELRWGGDWSMDFEVKDNRFDDLVHFEIVE